LSSSWIARPLWQMPASSFCWWPKETPERFSQKWWGFSPAMLGFSNYNHRISWSPKQCDTFTIYRILRKWRGLIPCLYIFLAGVVGESGMFLILLAWVGPGRLLVCCAFFLGYDYGFAIWFVSNI
jgi:hypothetical protein